MPVDGHALTILSCVLLVICSFQQQLAAQVVVACRAC